ncbi:MAG TPA: FecR family protein, partial [Chthoniobacterales bacterium]|nr:FecR family protein [Chthoniobacterales bacterium]
MTRRLQFLICLFPLFSLTAAPLKQATVTTVVNDVNLLPEAAPPKPAAVNDDVRDNTAVRTGAESRSELTFTDATIARLGANTIFTFNEGTRQMDLGGGAMLLRVPKGAGGARISTAAVTAAITGTTVLMQYDRKSYAKLIVLEGTACLALKDKPQDCVPVKAGQLMQVPVNPPPDSLPAPVDVDLSRLVETSGLLSSDFAPLPSIPLITAAVQEQAAAKQDST